MIERKFIKERLGDYKIQKFLFKNFERSSFSHAIIQKTPLGDKIVIYSSRPGMIVGRGGENLKRVIVKLKNLGIQNPRIDVQEVDNAMLDPSLIAERIVEMFLKMGTGRFKFIGHHICEKVLQAGAKGVQITLAGRIPASRAKMWKFIRGFLPKCGSVAYEDVAQSFRIAKLKTGVIGVRVKLLPPNIRMPDEIILLNEAVEESKDINEDLTKEENVIKVMEKEEKKETKIKDKKTQLKEKIAELAKKIESKTTTTVEKKIVEQVKEGNVVEPVKEEKVVEPVKEEKIVESKTESVVEKVEPVKEKKEVKGQ
jgi:small subunit ribosomal protein S3